MSDRLLEHAADAMRLRDAERVEARCIAAPQTIDGVPHGHRAHACREAPVAPLVGVVLDATQPHSHARALDPFPHAERADERRIELRMVPPAELRDRLALER